MTDHREIYQLAERFGLECHAFSGNSNNPSYKFYLLKNHQQPVARIAISAFDRYPTEICLWNTSQQWKPFCRSYAYLEEYLGGCLPVVV